MPVTTSRLCACCSLNEKSDQWNPVHLKLASRRYSLDKFGNEFGMMTEIGVHDDHKGTGHELKAMHVGRSEAELACSWSEELQFRERDNLQWSAVAQSRRSVRLGHSRAGYRNHLYLALRKQLDQSTHNFVLAPHHRQLPCNILRSIRARIIDNNQFPLQSSVLERPGEEPSDYW